MPPSCTPSIPRRFSQAPRAGRWKPCSSRVGYALLIWCSVSAALLVKHSAVFVSLPLLIWAVGYRRAILLLLTSGVVWLLSFAPFAPAGSAGILDNVLLFGSFKQPFLTHLLLPTGVNGLLFGLALVGVYVRLPRLPLERALLAGVLTWLVFSPGFATNYLLLLVGVAALNAPEERRWLLPVSIAAALIEADFCGLLVLNADVRTLLWLALWPMLLVWWWEVVRGRATRAPGELGSTTFNNSDTI